MKIYSLLYFKLRDLCATEGFHLHIAGSHSNTIISIGKKSKKVAVSMPNLIQHPWLYGMSNILVIACLFLWAEMYIENPVL
jgi:hypothetical protein